MEEDVPRAISYLKRKKKKNRRIHRETALEMTSLPGSQNNWIRLAFGIL